MNYFNNVVLLSGSDKLTGSDYTVTGSKGGGIVKDENQEVSVQQTESDVISQTNAETTVPQDTSTVSQTVQKGSGFIIPLMWIGMIVIFYFLAIRPQKKRDKSMQEMRTSLKVGDDVITSSGYYGKISDIGTDVFVIEFGTNKGIRIPVKKSEVIGKGVPNLSKPADITSKDVK